MILIVSQRTGIYLSIARMLRDTDIEVAAADSLPRSLDRLRQQDVSIVICDRDLPGGGWKALLVAMDGIPAAPPLVVTARDADDKLWAEVLNLGGYDVLAQPLDATEVQRVLLQAERRSTALRALTSEQERAK